MRKRGSKILPEEDIPKLFKEFLDSERAGGIILILCTILSIILANSGLQSSYSEIWKFNIGNHTLQHWINDGLMAIFFLLIGLELEREIYIGELSSLKKTLFPVSAAIGGMAIPALIYFIVTLGEPYGSGFGIPMATDIAFAIGILSLIKGVPVALKVFLTALAIVDDLGAILIIAIFYSKEIIFLNLVIALGIFIILLVLNKLKFNNLLLYIAGGALMWFFMSNSGVHPTVSGVLLAFAIPFRKNKDGVSPSDKLQHVLHRPVAFLILPLFALANTAILIDTGVAGLFAHSYVIGIITGLFIGKPLGILSFVYFAVKLKICALPDKVNWIQITGVGTLAGIGFTMSIFITLLAFTQEAVINNSKISILLASLLAGVSGFLLLNSALKSKK